MEFLDKLTLLQRKFADLSETIKTEEATKNAFVMPFLHSVLGYDVFDPKEVVPEFVCDLGIKKGEKIDYAIFNNGTVQMLVECKKCSEGLNINHASQLFRYFHATSARIGLLTNGRHFWFFTDLDAPNKMDDKPFLVLDLLDIDEHVIQDIEKLTKSKFDLDSVISSAEELKYIGQLKKLLAEQLSRPSDDFIRIFASKVYDGVLTQKVREQFSILLAKATEQHLSDLLNDRLKAAIKPVAPLKSDASQESKTETLSNEDLDGVSERVEQASVETTAQEIEGFFVVKSIVRSVVDVARVVHRDSMSYFAILLDDNNRKPICRLHLNRSKKYIGLFDADKNETRFQIDTVDDIYKYSEQLQATVQRHQAD